MSIKSNISGLLRKINLLSSAEKARFYLQKLKYKKDNDAFRKDNPGFVLPPEFFIYETYRLNYKWYYEDGKLTAEEIATLLSKYYDFSYPNKTILDWGCGPGRIVRHLPSLLPNVKIYGTDYNKTYIRWCIENLKEINFSVNKIDPPMNFGDSFFDAIIGLSIFTHLSEKNHFAWIDELYRIIKFGGAALITTQGGAYRSRLTEAEKKLFDSSQLVIRKYLDEGNRLYSSFQPAEFMKELIIGKFQVVEFVPGEIENNEPSQDSWLLQKI
jgi:ubiquinone/menaquinone biosynthesis C-methylase UbiE